MKLLKALWENTPKYNLEQLRYKFDKKYRKRIDKKMADWKAEFIRKEIEAKKQGINF